MSRKERTEKLRLSILDSYFNNVINFETEDEYWDHHMYNFLYKKFITLLCRDENFDYSLINLWPDKQWNWLELSKNKNLDFNFLRENIHRPWTLYYISGNPNIVNNFDIVYQNIHRNWNLNYLIYNYKECMDLILYKPPGRSIVHEYFYKKLSRRIEETNRYDLVKKMPDEDWDWEYFSGCSNLDLELVELLPNKKWDYDILYQNFNFIKIKKIKL